MVRRVPFRSLTARRLGLVLGACAMAGGCLSDHDIAERSLIEPGSPVAQAIEAARAQTPAYPKFSDIPAVPGDLHTPEAWRQAAGDLDAAGRSLDRTIAANPPLVGDTEAFLREAQIRTAGEPVEDSTAAAEAFLRQGVQRATPPPLPR
jgi:hypothetical protein